MKKPTFTLKEREKTINLIAEETYDLIIIGGGITGAGIALDAASRGLKTLLLEKGDFASGTSSKSTKLIHGGLRYLKQFEFGLVKLTGTERAVLHQLAPHLVKPEKMLLPITENGTYSMKMASLGLWVYDFLAKVAKKERRKMLGRKKAVLCEPILDNMHGLKGAGLYYEYRTDDARLTIEILKTAARYGATCLNYLEVDDFLIRDGKIEGVTCTDHIDKQQVEFSGKCVVSAAGPWVDGVRKADQTKTTKKLLLTKGVHIVVDHAKFPVKQSVYFDVPDGRMMFAIPRGGITYIGTTDTTYKEDPNDVAATHADVKYILDSVNDVLGDIQLGFEDVKSTWAGLRPLIYEKGKSTSEISRKDEIFQSEEGLISIAGGKLTGYRKMAQKVVNLVLSRRMDRSSFKRCQTKSISFQENPIEDWQAFLRYKKNVATQLNEFDDNSKLAEYLVSNYGKSTENILAGYTDKSDKLTNEENLLLSELEYGIDHEMITSSIDFFERRTGRLYFDVQSVSKYLNRVNERLASVFEWSQEKKEEDKKRVNKAVEAVLSFKAVSQAHK